MLNGKNILITGGTGSLGKKLLQIILKEYEPEKLIVFSRDELKQFEMSQTYDIRKYPCIRYFLGDVRDKDRLLMAFNGVDYVIHAAALKQVPAAEYNPEEFVKTNVLGAMNIINAAIAAKVEKVIALSTDKACNPINLYGATKLCSDKLFTAANVYSGYQHTLFAVARYGNVLGSRGSVVPFFKERAATGKLPITDERMTRFWITLDQAGHFVLMCLQYARGGEIFVPKIPSMKITDLATAVAPQCEQEIVGIRPGEKVNEVLIGEDDARSTLEFKNFYVVRPPGASGKVTAYAGAEGKVCPESFKYTSDTNEQWLSVQELRELVDRIAGDYVIERSRWAPEGVPR